MADDHGRADCQDKADGSIATIIAHMAGAAAEVEMVRPSRRRRGNWIQTDPTKGWWAILRLYSPLETVLHEGMAAERDRIGSLS